MCVGGASCYLVARSQGNSKVKRSAADVCIPKCSDGGKQAGQMAGKRAVFMDVISLVVGVSQPAGSFYTIPFPPKIMSNPPCANESISLHVTSD